MINELLDFSIVVTSYNCEKYIYECLKSILVEKDISLEVICVDDFSTDCSAQIISQFAQKDSRINAIYNSTNLGPASSRNIGLSRAKGRYICFVDGDDMLAEKALQRIKIIMDKYHLDLYSFAGSSFTQEKELECLVVDDEYMVRGNYSEVVSGVELINELMENADFIRNCVFNCLSNVFVQKEGICFKDGLRYADDNMFDVLVKSKRSLYSNDVMYRRRYRSGSAVTSKKTAVHLESVILRFLSDIDCWNSLKLDKKEEKGIVRYLNKKYLSILDMASNMEESEVSKFKANGASGYFFNYFINKRSVYDFLISDEDRHYILDNKKVYIYGAKTIALMISEVLESWGITDYSFVTTEKNPCKLKNRTIQVFEGLKSIIDRENTIFIIATSSVYLKEIEVKLMMEKFKYCKVNI